MCWAVVLAAGCSGPGQFVAGDMAEQLAALATSKPAPTTAAAPPAADEPATRLAVVERAAQQVSTKPVSQKPVSQKPVSQKPVSQKPVSQKPVSQKPVSQKPVSQKPAAQKLVSRKPASRKAVAQEPASTRTASRSTSRRAPSGAGTRRGPVRPGREHGYTIILPGILGKTPFEPRIGTAMAKAGVPHAVEVHDWTRGPLLLGLNYWNLRGQRRHDREAKEVAAKIVRYQDRYPGRPVHLIGHSGGGGIALLVLEALPPDRKITSAILLGAPVAPNYDLRTALAHTTEGIHNFYSSAEFLMTAVTLVAGTMDRHHGRSAGTVGFSIPERLSSKERQDYERLHQHEVKFEASGLVRSGGHFGLPGGHFSWTNPTWAGQQVVPLLKPQSATPEEPATNVEAVVRRPTASRPTSRPRNR